VNTGPKVLQLSTVLTGSGDDRVVVSSDKTIVGVTANAGLPRIRFGTAHIYDNLFTNASTSGIHCLMSAECLVQNNLFVNVKLPVWTTEDSEEDGFAVISGNDFGGEEPVITRTGNFTTPPYAFQLDPTADVSALVRAGAGTGRI
jgi:pectate lyase